MTMYVTEVGEVTPSSKCRCGDAAELHRKLDEDTPQGLCQYYYECTVQGCNCTYFEEVALDGRI